MALSSHNIDFKKMVSQLLGNRHRKARRIAWLTALMAAYKSVHQNFLTFTDAKWEEVKYNGQTFVMEKMLEYYFGVGITITNNIGDADGFIVGAGSDFSSSIGTGSDLGGGIGSSFSIAEFDFTVNVPSSVVFVQSEMEARIRKYKMFGTTFNIVIV